MKEYQFDPPSQVKLFTSVISHREKLNYDAEYPKMLIIKKKS